MHELDKCLVFRKTGGRVAEGYVHGFDDGVLQMYPQGESAPLREGEEILVFIYDSVWGECKYAGRVRRVADFSIEAESMELLSSCQKRQSTRVNKRLDYRLTEYFADGELRPLTAPLDIVVLNISATGLYFHCLKKLEPGFSFPLVLRETAHPVRLRVEILRREDYGRSYRYGALFADISEQDADEIFRFVFREQIAQRRRTRM